MGWQDAPIVEQAGDKPPAWAGAPIVQPAVAAAVEPKDYDPVPATGVPKGFHAVTEDSGKKTLRHDFGVDDVMRALNDLPGMGAAEHAAAGVANLGGKAISGIAGLLAGADPETVRQIHEALHMEPPPTNDPIQRGLEAVTRGAQAISKPIDTAVGNLPPGPRTAIEATEEAIPDVAAMMGARAAAAKAVRAPAIARSPAEVAQAAGYMGLRTRKDLAAPGNQAITDTLISRDAGMVPGQTPSIAALENAAKVGPGQVYRQAEASLPPRMSMRGDVLESQLQNLPNQVSQLPRSPDVAALQETMLAQPEFSRDELFANIREARERAKAHWKSDDPDKGVLGDAYHALADAYEDFAGRQLEAAGSPVSLADWQAARTQMAKNYQARGALRGEHFDPGVYGKIAERNPHLLTGNAAIVGHVTNGLPSAAAPGLGDLAPTALGIGAGELAGHAAGVPVLGGVAGALAGPAIRARLEQLLTRGRPAQAASTGTNPALSYFFPQGRMPPGWNRSPVTPQIAGLLPSPSMINAGGGATTASTLENLGLTPDVQAAATQHPAAARLAALRERLVNPPERPAAPVDFQGPQKWGDFSMAPPQSTPVESSRVQSSDAIPFENVLEQGGTERAPIGAPKTGYRPPAKAPNQPKVRTPAGAPETTEEAPRGPSPAQLAFRNKLAADRLRKLAGDLRMEGPGAATGSPVDRLREALLRRERGYAKGGKVAAGYVPASVASRNPIDNPVGDATARLQSGVDNAAQLAARFLPQDPLAPVAPQGAAIPLKGFGEGGAVLDFAKKGTEALMERIQNAFHNPYTADAAQLRRDVAKYWATKAPQAAESAAASAPPAMLAAPKEPTLEDLTRALHESVAPAPSGGQPPSMLLQPGFLRTPQAMADGGSVDDTQSSLRRLADAARNLPLAGGQAAEDRARIASNLASLFYGLDAQGHPVLGGRAWTEAQGGTPMGALDALTAAPHEGVQTLSLLAQLADKGRQALSLPGKPIPASFWASIDPSWSQQAAQRLAQLRQRVQQTAGTGQDKSFEGQVIDAVTDPALIAPLGAARLAGEGSLLRHALNWSAGGTETPTSPSSGGQ